MDLQTSLKTQIERKAELQAAEAALVDDAFPPELLERSGKGTLKASSVAETLGMPVRDALSCPLKRHSITGFPTRGRHSNCTSTELCRDHLGAIRHKLQRGATDREEALAEERRFIDHVNREHKFAALVAHERKEAAHADLLRAWETSQHVKNLKKLQTFGSRAMLQYAKTAAPTVDDETGKAPVHHPPSLPPARQLAATIAAANAKEKDVAFDPNAASTTLESRQVTGRAADLIDV